MNRLWITLASVAVLWGAANGGGKQCPDPAVNPSCRCFDFENGIHLECQAVTAQTLRMLLEVVNVSIQSLSIIELDKAMTKLPKNIFPETVIIHHIKISQSNLEELHDDLLRHLARYLESFILVSAKLKEIPQMTFRGLNKLIALELEDNQISEIPSYIFHGLGLMKLNLKANRIKSVTDYTFAGLESTLSELDISENKLQSFPMNALGRLEKLRHLRLSWNEIKSISFDNYNSHLDSLLYLDLSFNFFQSVNRETFEVCRALRTLSLYYNVIERVHEEAFHMLHQLEKLDLSHNKIVYLHPKTFRQNKRLNMIDLSHNHLHYISGLFALLPNLKEVLLSENNILEIPEDAFTNSSNLDMIYMQDNAVSRIDQNAFVTLTRLSQLHLSSNFVPYLPRNSFVQNYNLTSLSLDSNWLVDLEPGTFEKTLALQEVRLQNNKIQSIHKGVFDPLPKLLELHLQHNEITSIDEGAFRTLQSLEHINLQGNVITGLGDVFLHNASALVSVQLDNNVIRSLHNHSLKGQSNVQIMWLGHNRLKKIERTLFKDLHQVQKVYLNNNSIAFLEDRAFEAMRTLKFLDLNTNHVKQITLKTFAELHELEELNLSHNLIEKIEGRALINLKKLRILDLSFNPLEVLHDSIFQEGLPIRVLSLVNCSISKIEPNAFRGLNNLNDLNLADNKLSVPDLRHLDIPGLRVLKLSRNNLSHLDEKALNGLPSLQVIALDDCVLSNLSAGILSKNTNLIQMDLSSNSLRAIEQDIFAQFSILKELKLKFNDMSQIPYQALLNISSMESLSLSHNKITTLEAYRLNGMSNLKHLDLSCNSISGLTGFSSTNLTQLLSVDLSGNKLSTMPANFFHLSHLLRRVDLSENRFTHIPNAALSEITLPGMGWLNISGNPIVNMHEISGSVRSYPSLEEMHLEYSGLIVITSKEFELFPSLLHLHLSHNKILKISPGAFSSLHQLISLDLGVNQIEIIPQERLYGLSGLRILNVTHNRLGDLDDFPEDLKSLHILDISYNRITRLKNATFTYLSNVVELYLQGNRILLIAGDCFKPLRRLGVLNLSKNYLEQIPLEALKPLETQVKSIQAEGNPLMCNCDSEELWEWCKDHRKQLTHPQDKHLKCEFPEALRGKVFIELDPEQFCNQPIVIKLAIQDIQPFSVVVSWQSRNHSGLLGYQITYYSTDSADEVKGKTMDKSSRSLKLTDLYPGTKYHICVQALGNWRSTRRRATAESSLSLRKSSRENGFFVFEEDILPFLEDSSTNKCAEVSTLWALNMTTLQDHSIGTQSILTRRLGLIIGCCLGFVVFILLVSILGYLKVKKQRRALKREQPTVPQDYMSYRHFSIQSGELLERSGHPQFITDITNKASLN
ncbi:protein artichoke-like [Euwallacea similis]|uniref:protein artichoke-like n=1 Tax=Euwallacea similis TaxID=1736056 RepID=UPI00344D0414